MSSKVWNVRDFGAVCDGTLQTKALQAAVDACFLSGGGEVVIPAGEYLTATIRIRSNVTLHLLSGAVLLGSRDPEDYCHFMDDTVEPIGAITAEPHYSAKVPLGRWCNAIIRGFFAKNIKIIGEPGSVIDGRNCYDEQGEEGYRGPHGMFLYRCEGIELQGYTMRDCGNWANTFYLCQDIDAKGLRFLAGHDGMHFRSCDRVSIEHCEFHSGDDGIAGYDNQDMVIRDCLISSACDAMRLGGTDVLVERCRFVGPCRYAHRWKMSDEEHRAGAPSDPTKHRSNLLYGFLYFCCRNTPIRKTPGNIVIQNCEFEGADRLFGLDFAEDHVWCCNRNLSDITFRDCRVRGVRGPMLIYSNAAEPTTFTLENVEIEAKEGCEDAMFLKSRDCARIVLHGVTLKGFNSPRIVMVGQGEIDIQSCNTEFYVEKENG